MPRKKAGLFYRAKEGFTMPDGFSVVPGDLASEDHPVRKTYSDLFEPVYVEDYVRFYVEEKSDRVVEATKEPGKKRGAR